MRNSKGQNAALRARLLTCGATAAIVTACAFAVPVMAQDAAPHQDLLRAGIIMVDALQAEHKIRQQGAMQGFRLDLVAGLAALFGSDQKIGQLRPRDVANHAAGHVVQQMQAGAAGEDAEARAETLHPMLGALGSSLDLDVADVRLRLGHAQDRLR